MAKTMKISALCAVLLGLLSALLYAKGKDELSLILTITFATTAYHFIMRLGVGFIIDRIMRNRADYHSAWFKARAFEPRLYEKLKVKKWKSKMGTYSPDSFDPKSHTWDEIAQASCQAEIVHEIIIALSFLPLLAAIPLGALAAFLITSVLAACYDAMFVIMQRFNRPRIIRLVSAEQKLQNSSR